MKKIILSLSLIVMAGVSAMAQNTILSNPDNKVYFGIRAGGEITCPGNFSVANVGVSIFKNGGGMELGGICNIPVVANFYVEPGLKFYYDTYSLKSEYMEAIQDDIVINSVIIKKFGIRIPVMAGYHLDFADNIKVSMFIGPELEVGMSAKGYVKGHNIDMSENLYGEEGGMKRIVLLWGIGAGISYQHYYFGVNGGIGMLNMLSEPNLKFHENRVTFSIGYNF